MIHPKEICCWAAFCRFILGKLGGRTRTCWYRFHSLFSVMCHCLWEAFPDFSWKNFLWALNTLPVPLSSMLLSTWYFNYYSTCLFLLPNWEIIRHMTVYYSSQALAQVLAQNRCLMQVGGWKVSSHRIKGSGWGKWVWAKGSSILSFREHLKQSHYL